jgi:hypothetical protein
MSRRRRPGDDAGSFTAELAAGLPALLVLLLVGLTAVSGVLTKLQVMAAAREGALVAARDGDGRAVATRQAPTGASITIGGNSDTVTVTVRAQIAVLGASVVRLTTTADATVAREPDGLE